MAAALLFLTPAAAPSVFAQMVLPGAVAPTPQGTTQAPATTPRAKPAANGEAKVNRGAAVTIPAASALLGRVLLLNGGGSQLVLAAGADKALTASRLVLVGEKLGGSRDACRVEASGTPVTDLGRASGLASYRVEYPACPVKFEVLDGGVLVPSEPATCDLPDAECQVRIAGLWGPGPSELGPERIKTLERARGAAEAAVRSNYRALTASTKDRPTVMGFAKDQAQFSSSREETCRDYAQEGRHNFCATAVTQGRAAQLHARLEIALAEKAARKEARKGKRGAAQR